MRDASGTTGAAGGARLRTAFVVTQVALSFALAGVAGLLARSASAAGRADLGFEQHDTWAMSVDLETRQYSRVRGGAFEREAREALRGVPAVLSVTAADIVPLTLSSTVVGLRATDRASAEVTAESPLAVSTNAVSPGHFATLRIPLISGRDFHERDVEGAPPVAIVNKTLARRLWPGESALGKRVRGGGETAPEIEVVGVARDSRYVTVGEEPKPFAYRPLAQVYTPRITFLVRAAPVWMACWRKRAGSFTAWIRTWPSTTPMPCRVSPRCPASGAGGRGVCVDAGRGRGGPGRVRHLQPARVHRLHAQPRVRHPDGTRSRAGASVARRPAARPFLASRRPGRGPVVWPWPPATRCAASSMESAPPIWPASPSRWPSPPSAGPAPPWGPRCGCCAPIPRERSGRTEAARAPAYGVGLVANATPVARRIPTAATPRSITPMTRGKVRFEA